MRTSDLKTRVFILFFIIIFIFGASIFLFGAGLIKNDVINRAQHQIKNDLRVARSVFDGEIDLIRTAFNLIGPEADLEEVRQKIGLDYLYVVEASARSSV
ncbi:MAG TPA: hypothetical protein PLL10_07965, partial [Elusimicrobiales bacterium]|nr:hypothetical protein [Elusimicrobiales bacterium]